MRGLLLAAALLLAPTLPGQAEAIRADVVVEPGAAAGLPDARAIGSACSALFLRQYGGIVEVVFDDGGAAEGTASGAAHTADARVVISPSGQAVRVTTSLGTAALESTVPRGAPGSLVAAVAGDIAFLWCARRGFVDLPLLAPPPLIAALDAETIQELTGWEPQELSPTGIDSSGGGITLCFPHRWLSLGPGFTVTAETIRDLRAQAFEREPLQLSGILRSGTDRLVLISERDAALSLRDARRMSRIQRPAPGIGGVRARLLDADTIVSLDAGSLAVHPLGEGGRARAPFPCAASYVSALDRDIEGNLWAWDAGERRVRVMSSGGREIYSIKPLFSASLMQLPQQLAVLPGGSFLLAGSGEIWRFESSGIPVWRLRRAPGRPGGALPSSFAIAVDGASDSFTIVDGPSRRVLQFACSSEASANRAFSEAISRLDRRNAAELERAAGLAREEGLSLMAVQLGRELERRGGTQEALAMAQAGLLGEKARLGAGFAQSLAQDLLFEQAEKAFLGAGDAVRELLARQPDDPDAARLLETIVSRRREIRDMLSQRPDIGITEAKAELVHGSAADGSRCADSLLLSISVRNLGAASLGQTRLRVGLPGVSVSPSLAQIESLPPGGEKRVELRLALSRELLLSAGAGQTIPGAALASWEEGMTGRTLPLSFSAGLAAPSDRDRALGLADALCCRVRSSDPLIGDFIKQDAGDPLAQAAEALDRLGALRGLSAAGALPERKTGAVMEARAALRGLSRDGNGWVLLTATILSSLGVQTGVAAWPEEAIALLRTDIPLEKALAAIPALSRYTELLSLISRDGSLCLPVSGTPVPPDSPVPPFACAVAQGLRDCAARGLDAAAVSWIDPAAAVPPLPVPFPAPLPTVRAGLSRDTLFSDIIRALESNP